MDVNDFLTKVKMIAVNIIKAAVPIIGILIIVDIIFNTNLNILKTVLTYLSKVGISKDHLAIMIFITYGVWIVKK